MIETQRLIIRTFLPEDADDLYEYLSEPQVVFYEPYEVFTREECEKEALRRSTDSAFWAVCLKKDKKLIGNIYFSKQEFDTWELGYVFNIAYQGNGYAGESAIAVIDNAVKQLNARRIVAMCNPQNEKSWKLLERLRMRREGYLKQNIYFKTDINNNPIWLDTYEYGILACEWTAEKE
ncbi:ribosomal-protein-S5-alanine N-acetyltransferase [Oxobacter pfennigii]|uniref:Ribosomal-protein-S5-alanine N-acetyltransferase n=1 Tax=Oxobacter pfennigii TaxID=36849 RepID=A0A0P8W8I0_9CLOT|nr:GNAT family protein [Oxobacter pfennigii]KPU44309.1 ribosomal-protein-S5-alanine N-acetyltransferase [Oxobacter pfennigii]